MENNYSYVSSCRWLERRFVDKTVRDKVISFLAQKHVHEAFSINGEKNNKMMKELFFLPFAPSLLAAIQHDFDNSSNERMSSRYHQGN